MGRPAVGLSALLRRQIAGGELAGGTFLPPVRQLCKAHGVAPNTVLRALKMLQAEGLVAVEPRQGCRVLARANDPARGHPIAYVLSVPDASRDWDLLHSELLVALQRSAARRGWPLVAVSAENGAQAAAVEQLLSLGSCGVILDSVNPELLALIRRTGLPAVMVDAWQEQAALDAVLQNNWDGGALAAAHLIAGGHRRIGWLGAVGGSYHTKARFGGAVAALAGAGLRLPEELIVETLPGGDAEGARRLLSGAERPSAVLALGSRYLSPILMQAAGALGLRAEDVPEVVGWCPEELYARDFRPPFGAGPVPAAVVWSIEAMAEVAVRRLEDRRANPGLPVIQMAVPARLRPGTDGRRAKP
jgi:DNA-binding LacI/PurR family transcriptional regulator